MVDAVLFLSRSILLVVGSGAGAAHGGGGAGVRRDVLGVLEGLDHRLLLALLLEAGLAVGIDASLGDNVCAGAGYRDGSAKSVTGIQDAKTTRCVWM